VTETTSLIPGHPAHCGCGECGCYRAHAEGAHEGNQCAHGICLICAGCDECEERERLEQHDRHIDHLVKMLDSTLRDAATALSAASGNLRELRSNEVYDIELTEGGAGADMLAELDDAARHLRNAERIVRWRMDLFKEG
jgi:hypothetical protein